MQSTARVAAEQAIRLTSPRSLQANHSRRSPTPRPNSPQQTATSLPPTTSAASNGVNPLAGGGPASIQAALAAMQAAAAGQNSMQQQLGLQLLALGAQQQQGVMGQNPLLAAATLAAASQMPPASSASSPFGGDLAQQAQLLQTMAQLQSIFMQGSGSGTPNSQPSGPSPSLLSPHNPAALMQSQVRKIN